MSLSSSPRDESNAPLLAGLVVHWHTEAALARLLESWPHDDARFELCVVDNGSDSEHFPSCPPSVRVIKPQRNLGFAGGMNAALESTTAVWVLFLNADVRPRPGSLDQLLEGIEELGDSEESRDVGLAPRLVGVDDTSQSDWQLRKLPRLVDLVAMTLFLDGFLRRRRRSSREPDAGAMVEQPAAAALALKRKALESVGGLDETFYPAWFEDVDLAKRLADQGALIRYWPRAELVHELGSTVDVLGYRRFLETYDRNLVHYTRKHHGAAGELLVRATLVLGAVMRIATLWIRKPRRASSRGEAARGLLAVARGACLGFPSRAPGP